MRRRPSHSHWERSRAVARSCFGSSPTGRLTHGPSNCPDAAGSLSAKPARPRADWDPASGAPLRLPSMSGPPQPGEASPPEWVTDLLGKPPPGDGRTLDLDLLIGEARVPPSSLPEASFELIWSEAAFTRLAEGWAEWLLEARRL